MVDVSLPMSEQAVDHWNTWLSHAQRRHPEYLAWRESWRKKQGYPALAVLVCFIGTFVGFGATGNFTIFLVFLPLLPISLSILIIVPQVKIREFGKSWKDKHN